MQLYNKLSAKERAELIDKAGKDRVTISFYQYYKIEKPQLFRDKLFLEWNLLDVLGRIYVSYEGINAQLSVPSENFIALKGQLDSIDFLNGIRLNVAIEHHNKSFLKLKIKVRDKIVADGLDDQTFDVTAKGVHVNAKEFNDMLADPNTICVDMRNHYESEIGNFKGAICPDVETFKEELPKVKKMLEGKEEKKILLYCTGGIRCEKTSAYLKHHGFIDVNQLHGGIIDYARQLDQDSTLNNNFVGKNFVFDERRGERISNDIISSCHQCDRPFDTHVNCRNLNCNLLFLQCDSCKEKYENCCSIECIEIVKLPLTEQKKLRKENDNRSIYYSHKRVNLKLNKKI